MLNCLYVARLGSQRCMDVLRVGGPNLMGQMSPYEFLEQNTKMANKERYEVSWKTGSRMAGQKVALWYCKVEASTSVVRDFRRPAKIWDKTWEVRSSCPLRNTSKCCGSHEGRRFLKPGVGSFLSCFRHCAVGVEERTWAEA